MIKWSLSLRPIYLADRRSVPTGSESCQLVLSCLKVLSVHWIATSAGNQSNVCYAKSYFDRELLIPKIYGYLWVQSLVYSGFGTNRFRSSICGLSHVRTHRGHTEDTHKTKIVISKELFVTNFSDRIALIAKVACLFVRQMKAKQCYDYYDVEIKIRAFLSCW